MKLNRKRIFLVDQTPEKLRDILKSLKVIDVTACYSNDKKNIQLNSVVGEGGKSVELHIFQSSGGQGIEDEVNSFLQEKKIKIFKTISLGIRAVHSFIIVTYK